MNYQRCVIFAMCLLLLVAQISAEHKKALVKARARTRSTCSEAEFGKLQRQKFSDLVEKNKGSSWKNLLKLIPEYLCPIVTAIVEGILKEKNIKEILMNILSTILDKTCELRQKAGKKEGGKAGENGEEEGGESKEGGDATRDQGNDEEDRHRSKNRGTYDHILTNED